MCVILRDVDNWMVIQPFQATTLWMPPIVVTPFALGRCLVASVGYKGGKLRIGDFCPVYPEAIEYYLVYRALLGQAVLAAHHERPGRDVDLLHFYAGRQGQDARRSGRWFGCGRLDGR